MLNKKELCLFLVKAKKATYASGENAEKIIEKDNSTTLIFEEGDWRYQDNYFGGEPFGGREVVFFKGKPVYMMVYYGLVNEQIKNFTDVYKILREALFLIPEDKPFRGPKKYKQDKYTYINDFVGDVTNFFGEKFIKLDKKEIYKTKYAGGLVDLRK